MIAAFRMVERVEERYRSDAMAKDGSREATAASHALHPSLSGV